MDGNGRWAKKRYMPRTLGHKAGIQSARKIITHAAKSGIEVLTLFAFSSENWRRPGEEVDYILNLFFTALEKDIKELHKNNVQFRLIGDVAGFGEKLQQRISAAEELTRDNSGLKLVIAANYGGQWDLTQACRQIASQVAAGKLTAEQISEQLIAEHLTLADLPDPDLFIRTSGEQRISNFYLWQLAYSELYFSEQLWPDFDEAAFDQALTFFSNRQRRFGHTGEQLGEQHA